MSLSRHSLWRRRAKPRGALHSCDHGFGADAGVQKHVIEAAGAPLLLVELADDGGATLVVRGQLLVGLLSLAGELAFEPIALGARRGIHEDMEASLLPGERAGC